MPQEWEQKRRHKALGDEEGNWGRLNYPVFFAMLVYLDEAYERRVREGRMATAQDLREAIVEGAVQRVRPKIMTVAAIMGGLLPIMWTTGTGADVMKRIAAPMIGGMVSSTILTLIVIPVLYFIWKRRIMRSHSSSETTFARPMSS